MIFSDMKKERNEALAELEHARGQIESWRAEFIELVKARDMIVELLRTIVERHQMHCTCDDCARARSLLGIVECEAC